MKIYFESQFVVFFIFISIGLVLQACSLFVGSDGKDGEVFLSIDWTQEPEYYTDTNPAIPGNLQRGFFYKTDPGSYEFEYAFDDGFGWEGTYTIREAEPGESGSFFRSDGDDGKDAYYSIILTYNGIIFENEYKTISDSGVQNDLVLISALNGNFILEISMYPAKPEKSF